MGTDIPDKVRGAPEPSGDVFVYPVQSAITVGDITSYVIQNFTSFQITVKVTDLNTLLQP